MKMLCERAGECQNAACPHRKPHDFNEECRNDYCHGFLGAEEVATRVKAECKVIEDLNPSCRLPLG